MHFPHFETDGLLGPGVIGGEGLSVDCATLAVPSPRPFRTEDDDGLDLDETDDFFDGTGGVKDHRPDALGKRGLSELNGRLSEAGPIYPKTDLDPK